MRHILGSLLLTQVSLLGWGVNAPSTETGLVQAPASLNFPYNPDQGWFVDPSYLLWLPYVENMSFGNKVTTNVNPLNNLTRVDALNSTIKVENPDFEWSSGVRVGIGKYLPHNDKWDISLYGTYYYSDADKDLTVDTSQGVGITPNYLTDPLIFPMQKADASWRLNYFVADLMLGRNYLLSSQIVVHPYLGLRGTWQYQKIRNTYSIVGASNGQSFEQDYFHKGYNDYWGVGPRIGTHFVYYFARHWSLMGHLATSAVLGDQKLGQQAVLVDTVSQTGTSIDETFNSKDRLNAFRFNVEGYIGLGWEKWMRNHQVRIAPSVMFEGVVWFAMNQLWNLWVGSPLTGSFTTPQFNNRETRKHGNLGLMGMSFNFQVDF